MKQGIPLVHLARLKGTCLAKRRGGKVIQEGWEGLEQGRSLGPEAQQRHPTQQCTEETGVWVSQGKKNPGTCLGQRAWDSGAMKLCHHSDEAVILRTNSCINTCV